MFTQKSAVPKKSKKMDVAKLYGISEVVKSKVVETQSYFAIN